ncbi:hypothetical protein ACRAWD_15010 [Caulobacter segnis]
MTLGVGGSTMGRAQLADLAPRPGRPPAIAVAEYEARLERARGLQSRRPGAYGPAGRSRDQPALFHRRAVGRDRAGWWPCCCRCADGR